jgi:DNA-binding transcriptional LysR family regulator
MYNDLFSQAGLSLDRLRSFCSVAEAGGVTKAAGGNPTRQSQFSRQIKELETFFGTELTRRQGKSIVLSSAGIRLARIARESFTALDDFHRGCKSEPTEFSIGGGDALLQWLLFPRIAQLHDALPTVAFHLLSLRTLDIAEQVNDLRLDFGLVRRDAVSLLHKFEPLGMQTYSLFVPVELLRDRKAPDWKEVIASVPLATITGEGAFRASLEKEASKGKLHLKFSLSCSSFPQAAKALQSERYAAILPSIASAELDLNHFVAIPTPFLKSQAREICLIWNPRIADLRPMTIEIKNCLIKLFRLPSKRS